MATVDLGIKLNYKDELILVIDDSIACEFKKTEDFVNKLFNSFYLFSNRDSRMSVDFLDESNNKVNFSMKEREDRAPYGYFVGIFKINNKNIAVSKDEFISMILDFCDNTSYDYIRYLEKHHVIDRGQALIQRGLINGLRKLAEAVDSATKQKA